MGGIVVSCVTPLDRNFRVNNTSLTTNLQVSVSVDDVQQITSTLVPANSVVTLGNLNTSSWNNVILDYYITGYTPSSASLYIAPTTIGAPTSISSSVINYTYVDLTLNYNLNPSENIDLTINP